MLGEICNPNLTYYQDLLSVMISIKSDNIN